MIIRLRNITEYDDGFVSPWVQLIVKPTEKFRIVDGKIYIPYEKNCTPSSVYNLVKFFRLPAVHEVIDEQDYIIIEMSQDIKIEI